MIFNCYPTPDRPNNAVSRHSIAACPEDVCDGGVVVPSRPRRRLSRTPCGPGVAGPTTEGCEMNEDQAVRALPTCPPTYMQRGGTLVCTACGAVIGAIEADQIRHTTWHTTLVELFTLARGR